MQPANVSWQDCLSVLSERIQPQSFKTWLKPTQLLSDDGVSLEIAVPNRFVANWLENNYSNEIMQAVREVCGAPRKLKYSVSPNISCPAPAQPPPPPLSVSADNYSRTLLNRRYTFDNFVVGDSNQFAHAAAAAVAEAPGRNKFNPLYIYGGVGLGKTHLVQAIGNAVVANGAGLNVLYVTSEKFTSDFIRAIAEQKTADFANYYRSVDLLLIDDIQFLTGKEATQVQFFHTFNSLQQTGGQIVMTSDRPPHEINGLEERLLSRFQCGLVTDIQPPDFETRLAILNKRLSAEGLNIAPEIAAMIADAIRSNVRELEGFLIRLCACSSLTRQEITADLVTQLLGKRANSRQKEISLEEIQKTVAEIMHVPPEALKGKGKTLEVASARQMAMYIARHHTAFSLKMIGAFFGKRDHSTVIHSIKKVTESLAVDATLRHRLDTILKRLTA